MEPPTSSSAGRLLSIARSSFYYDPQGERETNLALMRPIDKQFLETPFYGVQQMTWHLQNDGYRGAGTRISMDGKGRCIDNIFIERLRRSLKYECVYLHAWETGSQAKAGVGRWMTFYNHQRPHAAHGGQPPAVVTGTRCNPISRLSE
jgi:hypothetical protein